MNPDPKILAALVASHQHTSSAWLAGIDAHTAAFSGAEESALEAMDQAVRLHRQSMDQLLRAREMLAHAKRK
jgi:hypothetical protein